jgi:membrane-associated phospholipid phosphatase
VHSRVIAAAVFTIALTAAHGARADGALGIDHRLSMDDDGLWQRRNQKALLIGVGAAALGGALWEGADTRLGKTSWQSLDAAAFGVISSEGLKRVFTRARPTHTSDPDQWFQGGTNRSFPSGEVTVMTALVTPYMLEYGREYPAVYGLALLPLYDGVARMKVQAHWQSDVVGGAALGFASAYFARSLKQPFFVTVLPHGVTVGLATRF